MITLIPLGNEAIKAEDITGKVIEIDDGKGFIYHVKVEEVLTNGIRGTYSYRSKGFSKIQKTGLFDILPETKIKVLEQTELQEEI